MRYSDIKNPRKHRLRCSITAAAADDAAHLDHRGMGGTKLPESEQDATPLTRKLHELHGAGDLKLWRGDDDVLRYSATEKGARYLRRVGVPCRDGNVYVALHEGKTYDDPAEPAPEIPEPGEPTDDDFLSTMVVKFRDATAVQATAHYYRCQYLAETRAHFIERHGEREGAALFREFRSEQMEVKFAPEASRMLTIGTYLADVPEAVHSLTGDQLYDLARVLKRGDDREEAIADALAMSGFDFKAARFPKDDKPERERITCPMGLSCSHVKEEA